LGDEISHIRTYRAPPRLTVVHGSAVNTCYCRRPTRPKPALRGDAFQQAKADHDLEAQELELKINTDLTRQIHVLTEELHRRLIGGSA
jgi:hypothetical protein